MKRKIYRHQLDQAGHEKLSRDSAKSFKGLTVRTSQSDKDNCDLNILARRFGVGALARPIDPGNFSEWDQDLDLRSALQTVTDAEHAFMALPAEVRRKFNNDPAELLDAIKDKSRHEELRELGIMKALPDPPSDSSDGSPAKPEPKSKAKPSNEGTAGEAGTGGAAS